MRERFFRRGVGARGLVGAVLALGVVLTVVAGEAAAQPAGDDATTSEPPKSGPPKAGWAPDPTPIASKKHWVFGISVKQGVMDVPTVRAVELKKAEATPRMMGRYAIELYVGNELLDRMRFNVPGAGDGPRDEDRRPLKGPRTDRVTVDFQVRIADNPRATSARFVDRATGETRVVEWPPVDGKLVFKEPVAPAGDKDAGDGSGGAAASASPDGANARNDRGAPGARHLLATPAMVQTHSRAAEIGRAAFAGPVR